MKHIKDLEVRQSKTRGYMWALFECECGKQIERMKHQGKAQTHCPECARKIQKQKVTSHGDRYTRLYRTWINMRARCNNVKDKKYPLYGGRGITICKDWEDFVIFKEFALAAGYTDELTIDRIDPNGNYEPSNCQFIPNEDNAGKDKISISYKQFKDIQASISKGVLVKDAYTSLGFGKTAYYNAKIRYKDNYEN